MTVLGSEPGAEPDAEIGIFGGSGFYSFLDSVEEVRIDTPYGAPSHTVAIGKIDGRRVAFIPRHGNDHSIPAHNINYRANLWAFKHLGVTRVISPCAAGSLQPETGPGEFVICDQVVDRTRARKDTFYDGPETTHVAFADPYCRELRTITTKVATELGIRAHQRGTIVVIEGPRFATRAESAFYSRQGWDVISMTQYPEVVLARELEMCFVNISLVTDYDAGTNGAEPVTAAQVFEVFRANLDKLRELLLALVPRIPSTRSCPCGSALSDARL